jgi:hypothetical protein
MGFNSGLKGLNRHDNIYTRLNGLVIGIHELTRNEIWIKQRNTFFTVVFAVIGFSTLRILTRTLPGSQLTHTASFPFPNLNKSRRFLGWIRNWSRCIIHDPLYGDVSQEELILCLIIYDEVRGWRGGLQLAINVGWIRICAHEGWEGGRREGRKEGSERRRKLLQQCRVIQE